MGQQAVGGCEWEGVHGPEQRLLMVGVGRPSLACASVVKSPSWKIQTGSRNRLL